MPQSLASLHVHFIFSTKNREPCLSAEFRPRLFEYVGGICRQHDCVLVASGGTEDHIHLLASLGRTISAADFMRTVKAGSSGWIHEAAPNLRDFHWQTGYGAFAVSYSAIDSVKAYLANQEAHHARQSFQDEFREFLRRHEIAWDERYVWD